MKAHTKTSQAAMTPESALTSLKEGNARFQQNLKANRDLLDQLKDTSGGQYPFATVLSCIDSRVPAELVFDQGLGDIFSARIAGNFVNDDILGSLEFASKLAGTKLIVVLGHTFCGAVKGACDDVKLGNLTGMLDRIKPAVDAVKEPADQSLRNSANGDFVNDVSKKNVELTIEKMLVDSPIIKEMVDNNEIKVIGAMYDIHSGAVDFYE